MTTIPPAATDPATAACTTEVLFIPHGSEGRYPTDDPLENEELVSFVTAGVADRETIRTRAYAKMRQRLGVDTNEAVNTEYEMSWTQLSFHDPPWDTGTDLRAALLDIEGVKDARYFTPTPEVYLPPHYILDVAEGDEERVADAVTQYYPGLTPAAKRRQVNVVSCPIRDSRRYERIL